jgi:hypothetical protein
LVAALGLPLAIHAQALGEFAWRAPVVIAADAAPAPYYRVRIPRALYAGSERADHADLRVYNAAGEPVPFAYVHAPQAAREDGQPVFVPIFPLRVAPDTRDFGALDLALDQTASGTRLRITTPAGVDAGGPVLAGYLVDAGGHTWTGLQLGTDYKGGDINTRVHVEASDDLRAWRVIASDVPILRLVHDGKRLSRTEIAFAPLRARYLRLGWDRREAGVQLTWMLAVPQARWIEPARESLAVQGQAVADEPGTIDYDLGGAFPVDRVNVDFGDANTVAQLAISVRNSPREAWRRVSEGTFYHLVQANGNVGNLPLPMGPVAARYWRVHGDPASGGLGVKPPALVVGWLPADIAFVARGAAPYTLAWGNGASESTALPLATLFPAAARPPDQSLGDAVAALPLVSTGASAQGALGTRWRSTPQRRQQVLLWAVLVVAALLLGGMGLSLARQMQRVPTQARSEPSASAAAQTPAPPADEGRTP